MAGDETIASMSPVRTSMTTTAAARVRALRRRERFRRRLFEVHIQRQHDVVARFGRTQNVCGLPITEIVHQHGFRARPSPQFRVKTAFNAHHAAIIRQTIGERGILALLRTVVALQIAQQMAGQCAERINADGCRSRSTPKPSGVLLLKPRDLRRIEIGQQR